MASKKSNKLYYAILLTSLVSLLLFSGGFVLGVESVLNARPSVLPNLPVEADERKEEINLVVLGDSLSRGLGDSKGVGYTGMLREAFQEHGVKRVQLTNLSVSGATSSDLLEQLSTKGVLRVISQADLITMTIGGNDLFRGAEDLQEINLAKIEEGQTRFKANLDQILSTVRQHNKEAPIYLIGIYNPFGDLEQAEQTTQIVMHWNYQAQLSTLAHHDVKHVPVADIFQGNLKELLYSDHFHPNDEGYRRIGTRLIELIDLSQISAADREVSP